METEGSFRGVSADACRFPAENRARVVRFVISAALFLAVKAAGAFPLRAMPLRPPPCPHGVAVFP